MALLDLSSTPTFATIMKTDEIFRSAVALFAVLPKSHLTVVKEIQQQLLGLCMLLIIRHRHPQYFPADLDRPLQLCGELCKTGIDKVRGVQGKERYPTHASESIRSAIGTLMATTLIGCAAQVLYRSLLQSLP